MESHFHVVVVVVVAILVGCVGPLAAQPLTDSSLESPPQTVDADDSTRTVQVVQDESGLEADAKAKRLSDQVREVLEHFKQTNPTGFPGADIPDPMAVPPMNTSFAIGTMSFSNVTTHGLGKFRFHEANVNLTAMKTEVAARIDKVLIVGNYTLSTWFGYSEGGFVVTLDGVLVKGVAGLEVGPGGRLRAEEIGMDVTFDKIAMDFKNLGFLMSVFQGIINKVGSFLFDNVKPFILSEVNTKIREEVDKQVAGISVRFPTSMTPIDVVVADARHLVRTMGFDPYHLPDVTKKVGPVEATLSHLFATGLSSFYRRGDVTLWMRDNVLHAGVHLATRTLRGTCRWTVHAPNLPAVLYPLMRKGGDASFTIDYLEAKIVVNQSLDTRNHPYLESLDLTLGPLTLVSRGDAGKLNHISEFGMNVVPNLLRYQIVDALEQPISQRIQEVLDDVSVEDIINERLDDLDRLAAESSTAESPSHVVTTPSTPLATSTPTPVTPTLVATTIPAS